MILFIKVQFIILFILYLYLFKKLLDKGFSFSLGIIFGILFFIFIPLSVLISTDIVAISTLDFHNTNLYDIILKNNIDSSILLILYLYSILVYTFLIEFFLPRKEKVFQKQTGKVDFPLFNKIRRIYNG